MRKFSDLLQEEVLNPIPLNWNTVNNFKDAAILALEELAQGDNIINDDGVIEKVQGITLQNSDTPGNPVTGLHRAYGPGTEKVWLRLANGILKSGPAAFATTVLSGLSTSKITPFINVKGKSYGVNETNGIIRYDPKRVTGLLIGIVGPYLRKKIAFFETDETWVGGAANNGTYWAEEWTGNAVTSRKISASASGNANSYSNITLDLSQFANSKASDDDDYISFRTFHNIRANIDYITVEFSTGGTDFTTKYMVTLYQGDFEVGDHERTEWKVKKGAFIATGSPTWSGVQAVRFTVYANANGPVSIDFDYCHLRVSPLKCSQLKRQIFTCENNTDETWTDDGTLSNTKAYEGFRSLRLAGTAGGDARTGTLAKGTSVDLSTWPNGVSSPTTDEIVFRIQTNDIVAITDANCLNLKIGQSAAVYWSYTWATKDALGLIGNNQWFEVRIKKSSFAAVGGIADWTAIDYVQVITSVMTGVTKYLYIDDMKLEQMNPSKQIADFESDETWTITGNGEISTDKYGVTEGERCLQLWSPTVLKLGQSYAIYDPATIDLTAFSDSSTSDTSDYISFSLKHQLIANIEYLEIWLDNNSLATFASAYKYKLDKSEFPGGGLKNNQSGEIRIQKSSFEQIGAAGGWNTIGAIKFILSSKGSQRTGSVFIDNLVMKRRIGLTGRYYYKYTFCIGDVISSCSEASDYIDAEGSYVIVDNIKTSQDSRINKRQIYRIGGDYPDQWMLVKEIDDNTTTFVYDDIDDSSLVYPLGEDIPQGNIDAVYCNNLAYDPEEDCIYYWGDPNYKNRVYFSHSTYYHVIDEDGYRDFPDDVMFVVPWFGQNIIFYKHKIQKVVGSIQTGDLVDLPVNVGACSYWAIPQRLPKGLIPFVGWDNVYLFDGYNAEAIGEEIKGYFKGRETYLSTVNMAFCKDGLYIGCKDKTGTPTYNDTVLRYNIKNKSWFINPDWNVNVWANADQKDDLNDLYYGDSVTGNIYSFFSTTYRFGSNAITSTILTGWLNDPNFELVLNRIELKAKGTNASTIAFSGFKNFSGSASCTGTITLTTNWVTYTLGPKNLENLLRGDSLAIQFIHNTDNAYFKMKDVMIHISKLPKRITLNEVTLS